MRNKITALFSLSLILILILITSGSILVAGDPQPYVILISFDGFRWDYARRGITPHIDGIKAKGASALSLQPVFPSSTFPNHYSIITGMYPENHGIISNSFFDPFSGQRYAFQDGLSVRDGKWYLGEAFWETAERQGIKTASFFWPGSEINLQHRRPTYYKNYDHAVSYQDRIQGVMDWLRMPENDRPHFITMYFHETDTVAHGHGTGSEETNKAIQVLDHHLGVLLEELEKTGLLETTNIILVSDHGMTDIDSGRVIRIKDILDLEKIQIQNHGAYMMVEPKTCSVEAIHHLLRSKASHYSVFLKDHMPEHLHFSRHPFISSLLVLADPGWMFVDETHDSLRQSKGFHGYDNHSLDMHGVFFAMGPEFKAGYETGTLLSIDIYPLLCRIFRIHARSNIDGRLERIGFVLKGQF